MVFWGTLILENPHIIFWTVLSWLSEMSGSFSWISPTNTSFPIKCWRESDIKSLKPRFWCFGILECKTYQKDRYHNFQTGTSCSRQTIFRFQCCCFFWASLSFGMWNFPFWASPNWNFCESCDQTSPKSFESKKNQPIPKNTWAVIKGPWMVGLCGGLNYPVILGLL